MEKVNDERPGEGPVFNAVLSGHLSALAVPGMSCSAASMSVPTREMTGQKARMTSQSSTLDTSLHKLLGRSVLKAVWMFSVLPVLIVYTDAILHPGGIEINP